MKVLHRMYKISVFTVHPFLYTNMFYENIEAELRNFKNKLEAEAEILKRIVYRSKICKYNTSKIPQPCFY